ncbi:hypothetical protein GFK26_12600 [Variovorax paradoxus]|uniref:Uncharacterized protein n=1 Tax=Variovorax paradoxus TaxID=34073 RepID=A0A5Q0M2S0_VARPD|nr:hypothetical protein [Variovorax paradoxus]QFZ83538.1 hypothetical protein GFK26_12600 [Variovorax paradoxus]
MKNSHRRKHCAALNELALISYAMNPTETDAENLPRTYRHDRQLPRILHRAAAWGLGARLGVPKFLAASAALRSGIDSQTTSPAPPVHVNPGDPMPMHLPCRLCCARLSLLIDDQAEIRMCEVLRSAGLIEAELPPLLHQRGRVVYSGQATVMRVTPRGHAASGQAH